MKIFKIQSISDIITNSSSEVFITNLDFAKEVEEEYGYTGCITVDIVQNLDHLLDDYSYIEEIFYITLNIPYTVNRSNLVNYVKNNRAKFENDDVFPIALLDICDHMDYDDWISIRDLAQDNSYTWYSNR